MDDPAIPVSAERERLRDRFRGAIVGTAVGDALGAPFEGRGVVSDIAVQRWAGDDAPLRWTDDTHMTLALAESLLAVRGFDGEDLSRRFAEHHAAEPWRGYGPGPPQVFEAIRRGVHWENAAARLFGGSGSYGNGGAMRVAPVGLLWRHDHQRLLAVARASARITHAHELGQQGAALQARAVAAFVDQPRTSGWSLPPAVAEVLRTAAPDPAFRRRLDHVLQRTSGDTPRDVVATLGHGVSAVEAVPAALDTFLRHATSFPDAVTAAVRLGGDTDTIAAMTGAQAGALLGWTAIPAGWRNRLEGGERLAGLADALLDVHLELSGLR